LKTPWFAILFFSSVLGLSLPASAQDSPGGSSNQATAQSLPGADAPAFSDDCLSANGKAKDGRPEVRWNLIYPASKASYVGGTVPEILMDEGWAHRLLRWMLFQSRQFRRNGQTALTSGCLLFAFNAGNDVEKERFERSLNAGVNYHALRCGKVSLAHKNAACTLAANTNESNAYVIAVPYAKVNSLSRAKYATSDLTSVTSAYATAMGGVLATTAGAIGKAAAKERVLGIGAVGLVIYYYFAIAAPRMGDNYIAVFVEPPTPRFGFSRTANTVTVRTPTAHYFRPGQQIQISDVANSFLTDISQIYRNEKGEVTVTVKDATRLPSIGSQVQIVRVSDPGFEGKFQVDSVNRSSKTFTYEQKDKPEPATLTDTGKVEDVWNGDFVVEDIAGPTSFTYEQPGPDEPARNTLGTVGPADTGSTNIAVTGTWARKRPADANPKSADLTGTVTVNPPPAKSDELFKKGDLLMFRIPNTHDYYNISMTLSSGTGLTFVSETAEKPAK
jgi:hypothetical protein